MCERLTDETIAFWASRVRIKLSMSVAQHDAIAMAIELRERRAADHEITRLADVCRGYFERNDAWPKRGTADLLEAITRLLNRTEGR